MTQRVFRGLQEPQMAFLRDDLVLLEHSDPGARHARLSTNAYAYLVDGRALLIDANIPALTQYVRQLADQGFRPAALYLSHRHVAGTGEGIGGIAREFKIPVLLHPVDARHRQASYAQVPFEDPTNHPALTAFGLDAIPFPGHTEGHTILYGASRGGIVFAGDAAMGTTAVEAESNVERLVRPPAQLSVDDGELRRQWLAFDKPVATVLPYHGTGYLDRPDLSAILAPLVAVHSIAGFA